MPNLTIEEFAVENRVCGATVQRLIKEGRLPATKMGRRVLISADARLDDPKKK